MKIANKVKNNTIPHKKSVSKILRENYVFLLMLLLPVTYVIIFNYVPIYGVQIAFRDFRAVDGILGSEWIGFEQFAKFFGNPKFEILLTNTLVISLYQLIIGFPIPIILALLINSCTSSRFKKTVQMVTYAPHFISVVVLVGIMFQVFNTKFGVVNMIIEMFGGESIMFMGDAEYFRHIYVWSDVWQNTGWGAIIYIAALSSVDPSLHEAAIVDGAGKFKRILHIDIPSIMPTIVTLLILRSGQIMNVGFEKVFLMQTPTNLQTSEIISTYVYEIGLNSSFPDYSYSTAIGLFNSVINIALIVLVNQISRKISDNSLW